jgi:hypothetical protein
MAELAAYESPSAAVGRKNLAEKEKSGENFSLVS